MIENGFISNREIIDKMNVEMFPPKIRSPAIKSLDFDEQKVVDLFRLEILKLSNSSKDKFSPKDLKVKSSNQENRKLK